MLAKAISGFEIGINQTSTAYSSDEGNDQAGKWKLLSINKLLTRDWAHIHPVQVR